MKVPSVFCCKPMNSLMNMDKAEKAVYYTIQSIAYNEKYGECFTRGFGTLEVQKRLIRDVRGTLGKFV